MKPLTQKTTRTVILGAGFGGLAAALHLARHADRHPQHEIVLIDRRNYHLLQGKLPEAAAGHVAPEEVMIPLAGLLQGRGIAFRQAQVLEVDFIGRAVHTDRGLITYDHLVIAVGSTTAFYNILGLKEHALTLKSIGDTVAIRATVERQFAVAAHELEPGPRRALLTFVIGGGGWSGVEIAAELAERAATLAAAYGLSPAEPRVVIVEAAPTLLPGSDPWLIDTVTRTLKAARVEVRCGLPVTEAQARRLLLADGSSVEGGLIIWTGGVRAREVGDANALLRGQANRIVVDPTLAVPSHPEVYVVGDAAWVIDPHTGAPTMPSAQLARQQGEHVARNILAALENRSREAYRPHLKGALISLGGRSGAAIVARLRVGGRAARWFKRLNDYRYLFFIGAVGWRFGLRARPNIRRTLGPTPASVVRR
ncbi:MAG: NAD(P)/FAD-dependent oxidoreductase [Anaerolineae bacterium]|nr:NAD(P)/FAD-dependent oxidoreductase [Anaerolineae bacterium]